MNDSRSTLNGLFGTSRNPTIFDLFSRPIAGFEDFMNGVNRINDGEYFRIDLRDAGDHYELKAELPGVRKEDINVNFEEGVLTIAAKHNARPEGEKDDGQYLLRERTEGEYRRSVEIEDVDVSGIEASFTDGILNISLKKEDKKTATRININ
ncbi:MAG TPA: Hsp20/alpha crystallin family protein [Succinivibrionaceae bacterium]|nr:Hsp20/alpha crystallin family protein [Succinivibrionaceae bacterium]